MRNSFTLDDRGAVVLSIQLREILRRPTRCDADGYPVDESPGPHAPETPTPVHGGVPYNTIRRPSRQQIAALRAMEMQP